MHKRTFQALKRTFMHVSGVPPPYFVNKSNLKSVWVYYQKMVWEVLKHA